MKKIILFLCLLYVSRIAAQPGWTYTIPDTGTYSYVSEQVRNASLVHYSSDTNRANKLFGRYETFWSIRSCDNAPDSINIYEPISLALDYAMRVQPSSSCLGNEDAYNGNWNCLGPFYNSFGCTTDRCQKSGRMMSVWVHPTNKNSILAGAAGAGLWKTMDGGLTWTNITDAATNLVPGTIGVTNIAVNPFDTNLIYLSTCSYGVWDHREDYGLGLIYSTNNGSSWQADFGLRDLIADNQEGVGGEIPKMAYRPGSNSLYVIYKRNIYIKKSSEFALAKDHAWNGNFRL